MTSYILISIAVVCFSTQFAVTKLYEKRIKQTLTTSVSLIIFTSLIGTIIYLCVGGFKVEFTPFAFLLALLFALIMMPYYIIGVKVLSLGSLAVYSLFMMLGGMLVPFFYGLVFLSEGITWGKIVGTTFLTASMILQAMGQKDQSQDGAKANKKQKVLYLVLCLIIFFINGLTGVIAKAHQINVNAINEPSFMVWSCLLTGVLGAITLAFLMLGKDRKIKIQEFKTTINPIPFILILAIGAFLYTGNFLHLIAAIEVPASIQFPLVSGGVIVLSAFASKFIFKEKLSVLEWVSIAGAFASTVLFAF